MSTLREPHVTKTASSLADPSRKALDDALQVGLDSGTSDRSIEEVMEAAFTRFGDG